MDGLKDFHLMFAQLERVQRQRAMLRDSPNIETRTESHVIPNSSRRWLSVDLGQAVDWTAICGGETIVHEQVTLQRGPFEREFSEARRCRIAHHTIGFLHRPKIGTSYPAIVQQVSSLLGEMGGGDLVIDQTGVGRPVGDMMRTAGLHPICVTITGGMEANQISSVEAHVPKLVLATTVQAVAQSGRLRIADTLPLRDVVTAELTAFSTKQRASGYVGFEARDGQHDDLVLAIAIGVWWQENRPAPMRTMHIDFMSR